MIRTWQWVSAGVLLASSLVYAGSVETQAENLLQSGQAGEAFELLQAQSAERAGDPEFDLLLGRAANQAGYPDQALFALERVLIAQPQNHAARLEFAQAYLALGDHGSARRELSTLLDYRPPPGVNSHAERLLVEMGQKKMELPVELEPQQAGGKSRLRAHLDVKFGNDSNVNSATSAADVTLPGGQVIILSDESRERDDNFMELGFGAGIEQPFSQNHAVFFSVSGSQRNNFQAKPFNTRLLGLKTGWSFRQEKNQFRVTLQFDEFDVADRTLSYFKAITPEWSRAVSANDWLSAYGRVGRLTYSDQASRDVDTVLLGGGWTHRFSSYGALLSLGAYYGNDDARSDNSAFNGRDYHALSLDLRWNPFPRHTPYVNIVAQKMNYDALRPEFAQTRDDNLYQATLGWRWQADPAWSFNAETRYSRNHSNIPLFEYDRTLLTLGARYDFY